MDDVPYKVWLPWLADNDGTDHAAHQL